MSTKKLLLPLLTCIWLLMKIGAASRFLLEYLFISLPKKIEMEYFYRKQAPKKSEPIIPKEYAPVFINEPVIRKTKNINLPKFRLPAVFNFLKRPKRPGRPRVQPVRYYYLRKLKRGFNKIFPTPVKIGIVLSVFIISLFFYSFYLIKFVHDIPSPKSLKQSGNSALTTEFYDRKGKLLYKLYAGKNRTLIKLDELPPQLVNATIAIEDKNFYSHAGVDLYGVMRALLTNLQEKQEVQGGSTITQQLIKNSLLTTDRTWERKVKEAILAFWTERIYSKQEILQMYFNEVPYGGPAWGVEAASQTYFGKSASKLDLAESAYLAGLPASPTLYSPYGTNPEKGRERQREVLRRMVEDHYISSDEAANASKEELAILPPTTTIKAPHFVMYVRSLLGQKYGEKTVSEGGLKVYTSLDLDTQEMAEQVVKDEVSKLAALNVSNGAAVIEDPKTGQILAMVGSKDYYDPKDGNFNVALSPRQPGSSIKPITYATAFKQGYSPGSVILDTPTVFRNQWETYAPVNYDGKFHGPVSIRTALGSSYNIPAVKMLAIVGLPNMLQTAKDLGITTLNDTNQYGLSLTLGAGEVKLVDMMSVYSTFSQNGMKYPQTPILRVTDSNGNILEDNQQPVGEQVLSPGVAYLITNVLADNAARTPAFGPNSLLNIPGYNVAVKTGTTDSKRDNWTFGYTPEFAVGVWVGNNDNSPMDPALTSGVTGAAPIWNRLMANLLAGRAPLAFTRPAEVTDGIVDGRRDLVLNSQAINPGLNASKPSPLDKTITFTDPFSTFESNQKNP